MEKRKGTREIEVTRWRSGGVKRGECSLSSNQIPMFSPHWNTQRVSQSYIEKRRGRKETEVMRRNQKERDRSSQ